MVLALEYTYRSNQYPETIENPQINTDIYDQLIFNKDAKTIQWGKEQSFQQMVLGQLDMQKEKNEAGTISHAIHKM